MNLRQPYWKNRGPSSDWMRKGIILVSTCTIGLISSPFAGLAQITLDESTKQTMIAAINDEYRARALYRAVIQKFGAVPPFRNIVQSEDNHIQLWNFLFTKYGVPIPPDLFAENLSVPDTLKAACQAGVEAEITNIEMYNNFLNFMTQPDLRAAFIQLRQVSQERHLPAFQRCQNQGNRYNRN